MLEMHRRDAENAENAENGKSPVVSTGVISAALRQTVIEERCMTRWSLRTLRVRITCLAKTWYIPFRERSEGHERE